MPAARRVAAAAAAAAVRGDGRRSGGVPAGDLATARSCAAALVEAGREAALAGAVTAPPPAVGGYDEASSPAAGRLTPTLPVAAAVAGLPAALRRLVLLDDGVDGEEGGAPAAVRLTLVTERDLVLARSLQLAAARAAALGGGRDVVVVGIVGAGHLAGIRRVWADARSPRGYAVAAEAERPWPADVAAARVTAPAVSLAVVGSAALAALALRRPRAALRAAAGVGVAVTGAVVIGTAAGAHAVRLLGRALAAIDAAGGDGDTQAARW